MPLPNSTSFSPSPVIQKLPTDVEDKVFRLGNHVERLDSELKEIVKFMSNYVTVSEM
jgi:hypothetical protein